MRDGTAREYVPSQHYSLFYCLISSKSSASEKVANHYEEAIFNIELFVLLNYLQLH